MDVVVRSADALGASFRRRRRALHLSQGNLGESINLRQATISALEAGIADTKLSTVMDVMAALGLELVVRPRSTVADIEALF